MKYNLSMKFNHCILSPLFAFAFFAVSLPCANARETAAPAAVFLDSIGFATHFGYGDTPYGTAYDGVKKRLLELGVKHLRDGFGRSIETVRIEDLGKSGIRFCLVAEPEEGTPAEVQKKIKAMNAKTPGVVDVIEAPNEPDLFWVGNKKSYGGKQGANGKQDAVDAATLYLKDLYNVFKSDPTTAKIMVMGVALGGTYEPDKNPLTKGSLSRYVDWGNFHPYFGGNPFSVPYRYGGLEKFYWQGTHPGTNIGEFPYALTTYAPPYAPKPMASSEAGCATDTNGTSETAHGKYLPRMFLEYFKVGIVRTYSYEFVDEFADPNNREARFGVLHRDLTPKPAYTALKNLFALLADAKPGTKSKPGSLDFTLKVSTVGEWTKTELVHHLLLQKSDGEFDLIVWHEVSSEDGSTKPRRQFVPPPMPCSLKLDHSPFTVSLLKWNDDGSTGVGKAEVKPGEINFQATDNLTVLRFTPQPR